MPITQQSRARRPITVLAVFGLLGSLSLTACGSGDDAAGAGNGGSSGSDVTVVASTDVWGSVAKEVAGDVDGVKISSIIDDPSKDPHEYEASTRTQLAISKADVVIENGGGYDDFMGRMLSAAGGDATVLDAVKISGKTAPAGGELNEHVWYDFPTVTKVADQVADALGKADPDQADTFKQNAQQFATKVDALEQTEADIKKQDAGDGVAITEPVPLYMLDAIGLVNKTPEEFSEAVEEDTDVAPAVLKETLDLFADKQVSLLAYNEQTSGPETEDVLDAAKKADVPVVGVTETLPEGKTYLTWMKANLAAISSALA